MILLWNSSGPISLPWGTPGCGSESWVGGYSPGWRGSAASAGPARKANATPIIKAFMPLSHSVLMRPSVLHSPPGDNLRRSSWEDMTGAEPKIRKSLISGRELFVCDNMVDAMMVQQVGA